jgi:hypothetical protein
LNDDRSVRWKLTESPEHKFARQQYEQGRKWMDQALSQSGAIMNELDRLQKLFGGNNLDQHQLNLSQQSALLRQAELLRKQLDVATPQLKVLQARLQHADECVQVFHETIDAKVSDLTIRQTELVKACQSMNLYPPEK